MLKRRCSLLSLLALATIAGLTAESPAQTIMLPTFRVFNVNTRVMVPDGGSMTIGGIRTHSEGAVSRGTPGLAGIPGAGRLFRNRGIGRETDSGSLVVKPTLIIMEEIEAQLLAEARQNQAFDKANAAVRAKAAFLSQHVGKNRSSVNNSRRK